MPNFKNQFDVLTTYQGPAKDPDEFELSGVTELIKSDDIIAACVTVTVHTIDGNLIHQQIDLDNQADILHHLGFIAKGTVDESTEVYRNITEHTNLRLDTKVDSVEGWLGDTCHFILEETKVD